VTLALAGFALRRLAGAVLFVLVVSSGAFLLARAAPGDAASELLLSNLDSKTVAAERMRLGLDRSTAALFADWLRGVATLDLGTSSAYGRPVADLVGERLMNTLLLAGAALALSLAIGIPIGILTGARPDGVLSHLVTPIAAACIACPPIVGVLLLLFAAVSTGLLSTVPGAMGVPVIALALPLAATLERLQSQATSEALAAADLTAAAARGVPWRRLLWLHAGRQSLAPVLGVIGVLIGGLLSGSLAVEAISGWPGLGRLTYDALLGRDLFLIAGCALAGAMVVAAANLVADIGRAWIDPRVVDGT
jgi:ABC-type dipeptide/oligopeptide/nickel transport system permease component